MLVRVVLENWMSFRDEVEFSMIASRERQHSERVPRIDKYRTRLLPVAAIYGANAAGKSNFIKALAFAQELVLSNNRVSTIPVKPFRLDSKCLKKPTCFLFELLIDECIYEFSFRLTMEKILEEKLVMISSSSERTLYHRKGNDIQIDDQLGEHQKLKIVFSGTQDNQLYLSNSVSQRLGTFEFLYNWFKDSLLLVHPDSTYGGYHNLSDNRSQFANLINRELSRLNTGINEIVLENVEIPSNVPSDVLDSMKNNVAEGKWVTASGGPDNETILLTRNKGNLEIKRLVAHHSRKDGRQEKFQLLEESDGTIRIIDILPAFLLLASKNSTSVVVVDELDRSLHSLIAIELLNMYLSTCSKETRAQLLFTTHDLMLMNQELIRRDEMWVADRNNLGASTLYSFSEYKEVRKDKDIRKSYIEGRLGGIPKILV